MNRKQCEVIQDLLPLYIDGICSDGSRRMISEHLEYCDECKNLYANMSKSVETKSKDPEFDSERAFRAINHKWKMRKIAIVCVSIMLTAIVAFIGYMVYQNVSFVHDFFSPVTSVFLRDMPDDEWHCIRFEDGGVLVFDSVFYEKEVTLDGNSDGAISIRISDEDGTIVLEETAMQPGTSLDLDELQRDAEYVVDIKTEADSVLLRFH